MRDLVRKRANEKIRNGKRRADWFASNGPCRRCGTWERLELDHISPKDKISHNIWSWTETKRLAELVKCQPLCKPCHIQKTKEDMGYGKHSRSGYAAGCRCRICTDDKVKEVNEYRWRKGLRKKRSSVR